ncbi:uncharacterized protein TNCV_4734111 [Trichonephila clavipes]|nr:uncharacterized protein TNCV_4734111 [Trichonephila clavipes]
MDLISQCFCLQLSCKKFPGISETKLTEGIFVAPDICKLMKDNEFETCMTTKEKEAWVIFKDIVRKFLGKDPDCKRIAMNKLEKFQELGCSMSVKIYTLSQKNICTQKKSSYNHETRQECSLVRDMQMIKISKPMRQG